MYVLQYDKDGYIYFYLAKIRRKEDCTCIDSHRHLLKKVEIILEDSLLRHRIYHACRGGYDDLIISL
jgi:hypothetical protein